MKEPIEPSEIRVGDLIRSEARDGISFGSQPLVASEWIATDDDIGGDFQSVRLYLLDRPKPASDLPTEPTLGWLTFDARWLSPRLAFWYVDHGRVIRNDIPLAGRAYDVDAFTPATAVPTAALDELRDFLSQPLERGVTDSQGWRELGAQIIKFLRAVDEAQS